MKIAEVLIEHNIQTLNHTFSYACDSFSVTAGMRVLVPFSNQEIVGFVLKVEDQDPNSFPYEVKEIIRVIDEESLLSEELLELGDWMSKYYVSSKIASYQTMLPPVLKPKSSAKVAKLERWVRFHKESMELTPRGLEIQSQMRELKEISYTEFLANYKSVGKKLIEAGVCQIFEKEAIASVETHEGTASTFVLSEDQKNAISTIRNSDKDVILLHGATGSGKTEVFLQMAEDELNNGKQVLFLVPEISLTPLMVERVKERFGGRVAIYHSQLNHQEKYEQYQLVRKKEVQIVVGTRSSVFMPFDNIGLIILDEEHDASYKQEATPKYHCRDVAIQRAKYHNCKVILSSATPSLESYARAFKNVYELVEMPNRIAKSFPMVRLVDMQKAIKDNGDPLLSQPLRQAINDKLSKHEQVILLLNRRGYTPVLRCITCGHVPMCEHCDVTLSYHKSDNQLKCHTCDAVYPLPNTCPECGAKDSWRYLGVGTQRLQEHLETVFPSARVLRMDRDTTSKKGAHAKLLKSFGNHEADILIGTQMIAKGLDFNTVTLVGILNADAMLHRSDYRGVESTFDVLAQACGRSGRGEKFGEVILQTYDTQHYAITCARDHDYASFFRNEMKYRHLAGYPPYTFLGSLVCTASDLSIAREEMSKIISSMKQAGVKCIGPSELLKRQDKYRVRLIVKSKSRELVQQYMESALEYSKENKFKSYLEIDMDPVTLEE